MPLDLKMLQAMPPHTIFAVGPVPVEVFEDIYGANPNVEKLTMLFRFVAKRGAIDDWAIYVGPISKASGQEDYQSVAAYGDKIHGARIIRILVPCDDEALARYRN